MRLILKPHPCNWVLPWISQNGFLLHTEDSLSLNLETVTELKWRWKVSRLIKPLIEFCDFSVVWVWKRERESVKAKFTYHDNWTRGNFRNDYEMCVSFKMDPMDKRVNGVEVFTWGKESGLCDYTHFGNKGKVKRFADWTVGVGFA